MPIQPGEPVYFLSLELQNVGAFGPEGVEIKFTREDGSLSMWTLILGENGVGKTTALECLFGLGPWSVEGFPVHGARIRAQQWTLDGYYKEINRADSTEALRISATIEHDGRTNTRHQESELEFLIPSIGSDGQRAAPRARSPFPTIEDWPASPMINYHASRGTALYLPRFDGSMNGELSDVSNKSIRVGRSKDVDEWLVDLHHFDVSTGGRRFPSQYDEVREMLVDVLPGVHRIEHRLPEQRGETVTMRYLTDDGWMPYANLGLGYKSVMGLIGDLAYRLYTAYPESAEPLKEAAVVLIDEIDLHLHPTWQRKLIGTLSERFPNVQFIATAHSPLMVQAAAGHNLVLLRRDPATKQVVVENDVDGIANWRLDQIVTSELFGVPSAVRPQLDKEIERRDAILAQETLTDTDRDEVRRIEGQLGDVPLGDTEEARRMNDLLRRTLEALEKKDAG